MAGLTILKKERGLGIVGGCGADPAVALRLRNAADYRLPLILDHMALNKGILDISE